MHGVRAGFCPLGELVQGDRYGRRPPGRSPGRAPRRGVPPAAEQRGGLRPAPAPCTGCKKRKRPLRRRHAARPAPARPPGFVLRGRSGAFALWEGWCRGMDTAAGRPGEARAGRPSGAPPRCGAAGACGRPPAPCTGCKKGKRPCPAPEKHPLYLYRIAPPPGAFLHHGGRGGIGWCSGRSSRRPIDT